MEFQRITPTDIAFRGEEYTRLPVNALMHGCLQFDLTWMPAIRLDDRSSSRCRVCKQGDALVFRRPWSVCAVKHECCGLGNLSHGDIAAYALGAQ